MFEKKQLTDLFERLGTPEKGRSLVLRARATAPVREVKSTGNNTVTVIASRKMGRPIRTESRHVECNTAINYEFDDQVVEYYAQPCKLQLEVIEPVTGEIHSFTHWPDFLVLRHDGIYLIECKSHDKLLRLADKTPWRYKRDSEGRWFAPLIEEQLAALGIRYTVVSDHDVSPRRIENYQHLADYFHPATEPCPEATLSKIQSLLDEEGIVTLFDLTTDPYRLSIDHILKAIADRLLVADLDQDQLFELRDARIFRDESLREFSAFEAMSPPLPGRDRFDLQVEAGTRFRFDGKRLSIVFVGEREILCTCDEGRQVPVTRDWLIDAFSNGKITVDAAPPPKSLDFSRYAQQDIEVALKRARVLQADRAAPQVPERTRYRWKAKVASAKANGGHAVLALAPRTAARGNRTPRLSDEQLRMMSDVIHAHWRTPQAINIRSCHNFLAVTCEAAGIRPPSYETLRKHIKHTSSNADVRIRSGKRKAYQERDFIAELHFDTPPHGCRPFQYVHIDHTLLDIEMISSRTGKSLGRPWLTTAIDAYTRRIVGFYLSFDPPSSMTLTMIIRDIVRRFNRLPEFIVTDNGKEFLSFGFEAFLQVLGVHLRFRPAGQPRAGSVMERIFGTVNTQYIHNLAGNTKAMKDVRTVSGSHLPRKLAEWTLRDLYIGIEYWATEYYDREVHPALDMSPRDAFSRGLTVSGSRPQRYVAFNQDFLIATCPNVDREGLRQIDSQRGVKVNGLLYWCAEFKAPALASKKVNVRFDPWDASSVFVQINGQWAHARCKALAGLGAITEFQRRALTEEYLNKTGRKEIDPDSIQRLQEFMRTFTPEGVRALDEERQSENKSLYTAMGFAQIKPDTAQRRFQPEIARNPKPEMDSSSGFDDTSVESNNDSTGGDSLLNFDFF